MNKGCITGIFAILFTISLSTLNAQNTEKGIASYYAKRFHKRRSASGEVYHRDSMVCAHKTYPFETYLEVWNPKNNKTVIVKVIDRGPHARTRIIDLSYAAAKELDIIHHGLINVEVKPYTPQRYKPLPNLSIKAISLSHIKAPNITIKPTIQKIERRKSKSR